MDSFWFNRFTVKKVNEDLIFRDSLSSGYKSVPFKYFDGIEGKDLIKLYFEKGFLSSVLNLSPFKIEDQSLGSNNLFWQFPCITEKAAFINHLELISPFVENNTFHIYLGIPWATFIDTKNFPEDFIASVKVKISGIRHALSEFDFSLRVHSVCQHVYWERYLDAWLDVGVDDLWLPHLTNETKLNYEKINIHPWSLYAVNVEDPKRSGGIKVGKLASKKKYLASFIGAHIDHYLTHDRLNFQKFSNEPDFYIRIQDRWHYEDVVYGHQVKNLDLDSSYKVDASVKNYNEILSDSVFALCPAGAGPNSLRLWEALAVGSIPVLFEKPPLMPNIKITSSINWDDIVVRVTEDQFLNLPNILRSFDINEINKKQNLALQAYNAIKKQTCF